MHNGDMYMAMLAYRSTPLENGLSSTEMLMSQKLRTSVPVEPQQLNPKILNHSHLRQKEHQQQKKEAQLQQTLPCNNFKAIEKGGQCMAT